MKNPKVVTGQCRKSGCKKRGVIAFDYRCHEHYLEARNKALQAWHDAIADRGANCEDRPEDFTETPGKPVPTDEQAEMLCFRCASRKECSVVRKLKILNDGVILDGKVVGSWDFL